MSNLFQTMQLFSKDITVTVKEWTQILFRHLQKMKTCHFPCPRESSRWSASHLFVSDMICNSRKPVNLGGCEEKLHLDDRGQEVSFVLKALLSLYDCKSNTVQSNQWTNLAIEIIWNIAKRNVWPEFEENWSKLRPFWCWDIFIWYSKFEKPTQK